MADQYKYDYEKKKWVKVTTNTPSRGETNRNGKSSSTAKTSTSAAAKTTTGSSSTAKKTTSSSSSSTYKSKGETNRNTTTSAPKYNSYSSTSKSYSYSPKNSTTQYSSKSTTPSPTSRSGYTYGTNRSSGGTEKNFFDSVQKTVNEWLEYAKSISSKNEQRAVADLSGATEDEREKSSGISKATIKDLNNITDLDAKKQAVYDARKSGSQQDKDFAQFMIGKDAYNSSRYRDNLYANIDALNLPEEERDRILSQADYTADTSNQILALARASSGDFSGLEGLKGEDRKEVERMGRMYAYDTAGEAMKQQLPEEMQTMGTTPIDIPADYDNDEFGNDIYRYKFGEDLDGRALTAQERQAAKKRVEMVSGVEDLDKVTNLLDLTYDPKYLEDMQKLNGGRETYQDVLESTTQYNGGNIDDDFLVIRDYHEGHVKRSPDEVQRAANRIKAATGVDVLNAENLEVAFDQAVQSNEQLRDAVAQAVYAETGKLPDGVDFDLDQYMTYVNAYAREQNRADRAWAEQAQFDDMIQQKYGEYMNAPTFESNSQPISLDRPPANEAEMLHEIIVGIDDPDVFDQLVAKNLDSTWGDDRYFGLSAEMEKYNASTITPEQRKMFHYLWNSGMQDEAVQYIKDIDWSVRKAIAEETTEVSKRLSEGIDEEAAAAFASDGAAAETVSNRPFEDFFKGTTASLATILSNSSRAITTPINTIRAAMGQEIDQYDPMFNVGRANDAIRATVGENLDELLGGANIAGWNIGSGVYQGAMSIADSWMTAPLGSKYGAAVMGLEAADAAMRDRLSKGGSEFEALRDAWTTMGIEWGTEKAQMDTLFGNVDNAWRYIKANVGSEALEELTSEGLNMIYDTVAYGNESDLGQLRDQLIIDGYAGADLTLGVVKEIAARFRDAIFGGMAGGFFGAAPNATATAIGDRSSGKYLQQNDAAESVLDFAQKILPEGDIRNMASNLLGQIKEGGKVANAELGRVFRELLANVDEHTRQILDGTMLRNVRAQLSEMGVDDRRIAEAVNRIVAGDGSATHEDYVAVATNDAAHAVTKSLTDQVSYVSDLNKQVGEFAEKAVKPPKTKNTEQPTEETTEEVPAAETAEDEFGDEEFFDDEFDGEPMSETSVTSDGEEVSVVGAESVDENGELTFKVQTADGTEKTVKASDVTLGLNDSDAVVLAQAAQEYGANAASMFNARTPGQDAVEYAAAFKKAVQYGADGMNKSTIANYDSVKVLNPNQLGIAYEIGRAERNMRSELTRKSMIEKMTANGPVKVGNVDISEVDVSKLNQHQRRSIVAMRNLAELLGINVKFTESVANERGKYTTENGHWDPSTLTLMLDVHAGVDYKNDVKYAMMHTASHELTHAIFQFADAKVRDDYIDFVLGSAVNGQKMTEEKLEAEIQRYLRMKGVKNRDDAIEEIVAEASVEALSKMTEQDIQNLADENPRLARRIARKIYDWVSKMKAKIAKAFAGTEAKNDYAKMMNDQLDELAKKWNAALLNAVQNKNQIQRDARLEEAKRNDDGWIDDMSDVDDVYDDEVGAQGPGEKTGRTKTFAESVEEMIAKLDNDDFDSSEWVSRRWQNARVPTRAEGRAEIRSRINRKLGDNRAERNSNMTRAERRAAIREKRSDAIAKFAADDATKKQSDQNGLPLANNHIDQRTPQSVRESDTTLFCSEVEEAQVGFAAAASMLLYDAENSVRGQKFFAGDGEVIGQTRMTSPLLEKIKDSTGWTWDKIINSLRQFAAMETGDTMPKNTVTNREMELYLDEVLSEGYTTLDGQKVSPWSEYIEAKNGYQGSDGMTAPKSAYQNAIDFAEYAFAGDFEDDVKYSARESFGDQIDKLRAGTFPRNDHLYVMDTPDVLVKAGLPKLPILMTQKHARSVMKESGNEDVNYHGLTSTGMKKLPEAIANSSVVIRAAGHKDRVVAFADMKNANGEVVIAPVKIRGRGQWQNVEIESNVLLTAYGKSDIKKMIVDAIMNGDVLYVDKKRSYALEKIVGVQFPKNLIREASSNSIADDDDGVKFSMREPVERTKDLIAVHNIREDNLRKALDLGGFPMPSIAIAKNDIGHQNFGGISLVFGSDTIDPKANKRNKVYSADAWTPTFPQVEYEVDDKVDTRIYNKLTELKRKVDPYFANDLSRMMYGVEDQLNRNGGEEGLVKRALENYGMKAAYLESVGEHANVEKKTVSEERKYTEHQIGIYKQIADLVGLDNIRSMPMSEIYSKYGDAINDIYPGASNSKMRFQRVLINVNEYFKSGDTAPVQKEVEDPVATREAIDAKIDPNAYERWVRDMYSGIVRGSGVYNGKELFTPSGNRRSFAATHYPATVEGIAKAMYDAHGGKVKNISVNHDAKSLRAVTAKSFKSIDEMHNNVGRLKARTQEEADALTSSLDKRLADLASVVLETKPRSRDAYESLMAHDYVVEILQEVAEKKYSAATIKTAYAGYGYNITGDTAKELKTLLDDISVMPVNIFEAKPERAVYFDEVKYAIVPDTMDADLRRRLEELVPDVREYADGDEAQRLELLNAREDLMFQLRDPDQISDRELLANVMDSAAETQAELDFVRRYRKQIEQLDQKQLELEQVAQEIIQARKDKARKSDIAVLQEKSRILRKQLDRMDGKLLEFEAGKPLQAVVKRQRAELQEKARERTRKLVEEVRKKDAAYREKLLTGLRDRKNESFARQKYLAEVKAGTDKLREMVTTPTNKKHVPEILRKPMAEFLDAFDFASKRQLEGGEPTKADRRMADAYDAMKKAIERMQKHQSGIDTTGAEYFSGYLDLPNSYIEEFDNIMVKVRAAIEASGRISDTPIHQMKSEDLHELAKLLRILHSSINKMNKTLANAKYATADAAAEDSMADLDEVKMGKERIKLFGKMMDFIDWKNATPYYAFERFGRGGKAIFESLMNGWDKLAFNAQKLVDFTKSVYNPSEVAEWERDVKDVKLSSGETVRMSAAQLMSIYCLAKRAQAVGHLMGGGIRVADIDGKRGKTISQTDNYTLNEEDLEAMRNLLNDRQREVADKLQADMVDRGAKWGNEVSMKRFGYKMFTEPNYFPVESDKNNMQEKDEEVQENSLLRLLNMSATKDLTPNATNAIVIRSIFDVYTAHMSDMAKYNALGLQILDAMKWLNYVERTDEVDKNGEKTGKIKTRSVRKSLENAYGAEARRYIVSFIRNLNGDVEAGLEDGIFNRMTSNYKIAAVGANLRVGMLQITSMPRAATVIDPKYLMAGLAKWNARRGKTSKQAIEKVGIAKWKSMGFYDTNISRNLRQMIKHDETVVDKVREGSMKLAEWGDAWTMGVLYGAVESELLHTEKKLAPGTEAWDKRVNERMREIIYRTQVVDSTMTRSHLMRQKGAISGALAFMSEPTLTLNMLNDAIFKVRMDARQGKKWNPATAKTVAKVMAVTATVNVFAAMVEALFSALRDDDEFEKFSEKYLTALFGDYSDAETFGDRLSAFMSGSYGSKFNLLDNIPVVSDIIDAAKSGAADQMWQAFAGEIGEGYRAMMKVMREGGSLADYYRAVYKLMGGASKAVGLPVSNAMRDVASIYNTIVAEPMGWRRLQTYENTNSEAAAALLEAQIAGDDKKTAKVRERIAAYNMDQAKIAQALAKQAEEAYAMGRIDRSEAEAYMTGDGGKRSRQVKEALLETDYEIETGLEYGNMKADYISGVLSESDARKYLKKYDGLRDKEIDERIKQWQYEKSTGLSYGNMKQDYIDGELTDSEVKSYRMKYGGADEAAVETLLGEWQYEKDTGLLWKELKLDYIDGVISESKLRDYLKVYGGKDAAAIDETINRYDYYVVHGTDDGYTKYWRIPYEYEHGGDYGMYIDKAYQNLMYGDDPQDANDARTSIARSLASYYKPKYLPIRNTAQGAAMLEEILDVYVAVGYGRDYERKYIADNW